MLFNCHARRRPRARLHHRPRRLRPLPAGANRRCTRASRRSWRACPSSCRAASCWAAAREQCDPDLERLAQEYLPLTFSRRHGDPSRPWNDFPIAVRDAAGQPLLDYQGNWRDLFQNWEALAPSFPGYLEGMIAKFLDASTADGHNPYRVTRAGFEWEVQDPHDAWSHIGYWGDHQVIYLLRLLELSARFQPGRLQALLGPAALHLRRRPLPHPPLRRAGGRSPGHHRLRRAGAPARRWTARPQLGVRRQAAAGRRRRSRSGSSLVEKLLVLVLASLANFVPEAGLWLNTQRPEWNDANNALVGNGASMVTLAYLRRFLRFARDLLGTTRAPFEVSAELAHGVRADALGAAGARAGAAAARSTTSSGGSCWRRWGTRSASTAQKLYRDGPSGAAVTPRRRGRDQPSATRPCATSTTRLRANRRDDGLYHAYNLIKFGAEGIRIRRLPEMLEGQVAVLSSGALDIDQSLALLDALRSSAPYRADQDSYLLYPDRQLPAFLQKNRVPPEAVRAVPWLVAPSGAARPGATPVLVRDEDGLVSLRPPLPQRPAAGRGAGRAPREPPSRRPAGRKCWTCTNGCSTTTRSPAARARFYKYEGLGCIYWHMVSKLRLAVQEVWQRALRGRAPAEHWPRLREHYLHVREGLGVHKPPGALRRVPHRSRTRTRPASPAPSSRGMTGQVKEDILCRLRELGLVVAGRPPDLRAGAGHRGRVPGRAGGVQLPGRA